MKSFSLIFFLFAVTTSWKLQPIRHKSDLTRRVFASLALIGSLVHPLPALSDSNLKDQLKVLQALQIEQQKYRIQNAESPTGKLQEKETIVKGGVYLLSMNGASVNPSEYPLGLPSATSLDTVYDQGDAALILSAVGREGPPFAAKKFPLKDQKFPFPFELTSQDLMFPYTAEAWGRSPLRTGSISVACVLDADGRLATPSTNDRFGYAISVVLNQEQVNKGTPLTSTSLSTSASGEAEMSVARSEVSIDINLKADGRPYSSDELELMSKVDTELERMTSPAAPP